MSRTSTMFAGSPTFVSGFVFEITDVMSRYFLPDNTQPLFAVITAKFAPDEVIEPFVMTRSCIGSENSTYIPVPVPLSAALYSSAVSVICE